MQIRLAFALAVLITISINVSGETNPFESNVGADILVRGSFIQTPIAVPIIIQSGSGINGTCRIQAINATNQMIPLPDGSTITYNTPVGINKSIDNFSFSDFKLYSNNNELFEIFICSSSETCTTGIKQLITYEGQKMQLCCSHTNSSQKSSQICSLNPKNITIEGVLIILENRADFFISHSFNVTRGVACPVAIVSDFDSFNFVKIINLNKTYDLQSYSSSCFLENSTSKVYQNEDMISVMTNNNTVFVVQKPKGYFFIVSTLTDNYVGNKNRQMLLVCSNEKSDARNLVTGTNIFTFINAPQLSDEELAKYSNSFLPPTNIATDIQSFLLRLNSYTIVDVKDSVGDVLTDSIVTLKFEIIPGFIMKDEYSIGNGDLCIRKDKTENFYECVINVPKKPLPFNFCGLFNISNLSNEYEGSVKLKFGKDYANPRPLDYWLTKLEVKLSKDSLYVKKSIDWDRFAIIALILFILSCVHGFLTENARAAGATDHMKATLNYFELPTKLLVGLVLSAYFFISIIYTIILFVVVVSGWGIGRIVWKLRKS